MSTFLFLFPSTSVKCKIVSHKRSSNTVEWTIISTVVSVQSLVHGKYIDSEREKKEKEEKMSYFLSATFTHSVLSLRKHLHNSRDNWVSGVHTFVCWSESYTSSWVTDALIMSYVVKAKMRQSIVIYGENESFEITTRDDTWRKMKKKSESKINKSKSKVESWRKIFSRITWRVWVRSWQTCDDNDEM